MNEFVRQAIIVVLCAPIAYLILRLILRNLSCLHLVLCYFICTLYYLHVCIDR